MRRRPEQGAELPPPPPLIEDKALRVDCHRSKVTFRRNHGKTGMPQGRGPSPARRLIGQAICHITVRSCPNRLSLVKGAAVTIGIDVQPIGLDLQVDPMWGAPPSTPSSFSWATRMISVARTQSQEPTQGEPNSICRRPPHGFSRDWWGITFFTQHKLIVLNLGSRNQSNRRSRSAWGATSHPRAHWVANDSLQRWEW